MLDLLCEIDLIIAYCDGRCRAIQSCSTVQVLKWCCDKFESGSRGRKLVMIFLKLCGRDDHTISNIEPQG